MVVILSVDIGTGSLKAGLLDVESSRWLATSARPIATHTQSDRTEQNADEYWSALVSAVDELVHARSSDMVRVAAIGVTGQMRSLVLVDRQAQPVGSVLTLYDRRAAIQYAEFVSQFGLEQIYRWTGQRFDVASTPAKLRWLAQNEPQRLRETHKILAPKDFLRLRLTDTWFTDPTDAAGWLLSDIASSDWQRDLAKFSGLNAEQLPEIKTSSAIANRLQPDLCTRWKMNSDVVVAVGAGDDVAATGCGALEPGDVYEHLGSTGSLFVIADRMLFDERQILECYPSERPDRFWIGGSFNAAGTAIARALELSPLCRDEKVDWSIVSAALNQWMNAPPDSRPLFLPYLGGERCPLWDPRIRGGFVGLLPEHTPEEIALAIYEGPALLLAWIHEELKRLAPQSSKQGRICSAGKAGELEAYGRLRATLYGRAVHRPDCEDAALQGAALVAGVAAGIWSSAADAPRACFQPRWVAENVVELERTYADRLAGFQNATCALQVRSSA